MKQIYKDLSIELVLCEGEDIVTLSLSESADNFIDDDWE